MAFAMAAAPGITGGSPTPLAPNGPKSDGTWTMTSLIPTEHELRRPRQLEIDAAVFLDAEATGPEATPARAAADFASRCPTPWPAPWLPGATARAERMSEPPTRLRALRVPPRSDTDEDVVDAVIRLVTAAPCGQRTSTGDGCDAAAVTGSRPSARWRAIVARSATAFWVTRELAVLICCFSRAIRVR